MNESDKLWCDLCRSDWKAFMSIMMEVRIEEIDRIDKRLQEIRR